MENEKFIVYGMLVFWGGVTMVQAVVDPIANIQPLSRSQRERATDHEAGRLPKQFWQNNREQEEEGFQESPSLPKEAIPYKRDADQNLLVESSVLRRQQTNRVETRNKGASTESQCTYTFVVPQQSQHCHGSTSPTRESVTTRLQNEVVDAQRQIRELKHEFRANANGSKDASGKFTNLQQSIETLQQESRNMNSRVSQLYMQLLHEIINKRDNSLEMRELQNKLLNQTVIYHKLKEDQDVLEQQHAQLHGQINLLSQELQILRHQVQRVSSQKHAFQPASTPKSIKALFEGSIMPPSPPTTNFPSGPFSDCAAVQQAGYTRSGIFNLKLPGYDKKIRVWCDFDQDPGGWIVIQRRTGRRVNFYRNMAAYKKGFGRAHSDYWLGLNHLHRLTNQSGVNFKLHIDLEDWNGRKTFVEYRSFRVEGEAAGFKLKINHYSGTAGDSLTWHNNMRFTTMDNDNDRFVENCAIIHRGGWWYNSCAHSNLNGIYYRGGNYRNHHQNGIYWSEWKGVSYSLKSVAMKIIPTDTIF